MKSRAAFNSSAERIGDGSVGCRLRLSSTTAKKRLHLQGSGFFVAKQARKRLFC
jgi:hypothetical protein